MHMLQMCCDITDKYNSSETYTIVHTFIRTEQTRFPEGPAFGNSTGKNKNKRLAQAAFPYKILISPYSQRMSVVHFLRGS